MFVKVMTVVVAGIVLVAGVAQAGTMSVSATAPIIDGADIAMLNTAGAFDTGGNEGGCPFDC